jgi:hypothetical protein
MARYSKTPEFRWLVVREDLDDQLNDVRDEFPILYGSEAAATVMMDQLNAGADPSFFDGENGLLSVERIQI